MPPFVANTWNALPAGAEPVSRFSLKVSSSSAPFTSACLNVGTVLLVTAWSVKLATLPTESLSALSVPDVGWV